MISFKLREKPLKKKKTVTLKVGRQGLSSKDTELLRWEEGNKRKRLA